MISVDISDDHICGATLEDIRDFRFECTGKCYRLEVFAACESVCTDFSNGGGNGDGFEGLACPECHFADAFKTFSEDDGFELGAEGERLLCDLIYACGNSDGFEVVLEAEDALTNADLENGELGAVCHGVFGIENDVCGCLILFPVEDRNADVLVGVLIFYGSDDVIVVEAIDDLGVNEDDGTLSGSFCCGCGSGSFTGAYRGRFGCLIVVCCGFVGFGILAGCEECRSHTNYKKESDDFFHNFDHAFHNFKFFFG